MGTVSVSLPSDGQTIDAADYNTPINTIVTAVNGNLDSDNIAEGGVVPNSLTDGTGTSWVWQSWTPTLTGFSADPASATYYYCQIGKTVFLNIAQPNNGTSNATGFTITLPVTAVTRTGMTWSGTFQPVNNTSGITTPGLAFIQSGGTVVTLYRDFIGASWTSSGGKACRSLTMFYEAA